MVLITKASASAPCGKVEPVGCLIFSAAGPSKPPMLPPTSCLGFAVAPTKTIVKLGLTMCGMWCAV
jgi:hypothetical protein